MRKKTENSPTKLKILESAKTLMLTKGYAGTSVDEICACAKVTKGNFFYHFKTKEALGKELLQCFAGAMRDGFCCALEGTEDPLRRIYACLDHMAELSRKPGFKGCLMGTLAQESDAIGPDLRAVCGEGLKRGAEFFEGELKAAIRRYAPKPAVDARKLADLLAATMQGSFILMKANGGDTRVVRSNINLVKDYLKSVFGK